MSSFRRCISGLAVLVVVLGWTASPCAGQSYNAPHTATRPVLNEPTVHVHAMPGQVRVRGRSGVDSVRVEGTARAFSPEAADEARIEIKRKNGTLHVRPTVRKPKAGTPRFDLQVTVPDDAAVRLDGGPGGLMVQNVRSVAVQTWEGDVHVRRVLTGVAINRTKGTLQLQDVAGRVRVLDGTGTLTARNLSDGITVEKHREGRITIGESAGPVVIGNDGAGDVEVYDLDGSVHVKADGEGDIQVRNLTQGLRVDLDTAGRIRHTGVAGTVRLP